MADGAGALAPVPDAGVDDAADALMARLEDQVAASIGPLVRRIDQDGFYPVEALKALGQSGAYAWHLAAHAPLGRPDLWRAIEAMGVIGATCMASAFCAWCQDTCGWYLEQSSNAALRHRLQGAIARGGLLGGTGLSNPMKALGGMEKFNLIARRATGGYVVTGALPWVSNLGEGHWFGTIAEDAADPAHRIMFMAECGQPGVAIRHGAKFMALEGTGTLAVQFRDAFIADEQLLADPLGDFARRIRTGFTLLQTGMGFGVIEGCIALMREADTTHGEINQYLPDGADEFEDRAGLLRARIQHLAATPTEPAPDYLREVLQARLAISELTLAATQAATLHAGARGYIATSAVNRRQREGVFVAIITPSVRHLRRELAAMSRN